jgi:anaerobic ribonucleoside-triphosphate reductase activating protein
LFTLLIHDFIDSSRANGPGQRAVLWLQGCALSCPGCFNPQTHTFHSGQVESVSTLFERIRRLEEHIQRLTVSGGEPLHQIGPLTALLQRVRLETRLSILLFSGYTWEEIQSLRGAASLLAQLDVLIAGRYQAGQGLRNDVGSAASGLLGSANKTVHLLTDRYNMGNLREVPEAEVILTPQGEILVTGIRPLTWE